MIIGSNFSEIQDASSDSDSNTLNYFIYIGIPTIVVLVVVVTAVALILGYLRQKDKKMEKEAMNLDAVSKSTEES